MSTFLPVSCSFFDYNNDFLGIHKQKKSASKRKGCTQSAWHVTTCRFHDYLKCLQHSWVRCRSIQSWIFLLLKITGLHEKNFCVYFHTSTHCVEDQDPLMSNADLRISFFVQLVPNYLIVNNIMWKLMILWNSSEHNCLQLPLNPTLLQP